MKQNDGPRRIQMKRTHGWSFPPNTIKVDRATKWGNPFVVGTHGTRAECYQLFEDLMNGFICMSDGPDPKIQRDYLAMVKENRHQLCGKNLACWCPLPDAGEEDKCHAAVLMRLKGVK